MTTTNAETVVIPSELRPHVEKSVRWTISSACESLARGSVSDDDFDSHLDAVRERIGTLDAVRAGSAIDTKLAVMLAEVAGRDLISVAVDRLRFEDLDDVPEVDESIKAARTLRDFARLYDDGDPQEGEG